MPKGCLYAEFEVLDAPEFEKYREKAGAVSAAFGGPYDSEAHARRDSGRPSRDGRE
jgi:hypothetical protein